MYRLFSLHAATSMRVAAVLILVLAGGCVTSRNDRTPVAEEEAASETPPGDMIIIAPDNTQIAWDTLLQCARAADIIVLAEQHDDLLAHRFQAAFIEALVEITKVAVCMEMFERDEQPLLDAYLAGTMAQMSLVDVTDSKDWGAKGKWDEFYQPIVDAAKAGGVPVIAANAPRRFVRLGRLEGFEDLAALAVAYPNQFVVPGPIEESVYYERFKATMSHHGAPPAKGVTTPAPPSMTEEQFNDIFRAQQVWDATMAESVINARRAHGKAVLIVGQFHTDFDGGLLRRMKALEPNLTYLTISLQKAAATGLREEDKDRADFVVFRPVATQGAE